MTTTIFLHGTARLFALITVTDDTLTVLSVSGRGDGLEKIETCRAAVFQLRTACRSDEPTGASRVNPNVDGMSVSNFTQTEADPLIALAKRRVDATEHKYPVAGARITIRLVSTDRHESFLLDLRRSRIDFAKRTCQNRARQGLVRLDFGGPSHRNPKRPEGRNATSARLPRGVRRQVGAFGPRSTNSKTSRGDFSKTLDRGDAG